MLMHSDLMLAQANHRQHELIADADRHRLLAAARRARKAIVRGQPTGNAVPAGRAMAPRPT